MMRTINGAMGLIDQILIENTCFAGSIHPAEPRRGIQSLDPVRAMKAVALVFLLAAAVPALAEIPWDV